MLLGFPDQRPLSAQICLITGCPNVRWIDVPRVGTGEERVNAFFSQVIDALTIPLTDLEKQGGIYNPPPDPRIAFVGTLDDAQEFFQQTTLINNCRNCPIAQWTDGLPIIIPTEENVKQMLTGTSRDLQEEITLPVDVGGTPAGTVVTYYPNSWKATVEKVAVNAVMAGCKPEYLPVVLAIASSGLRMPTSNMLWNGWVLVSGPIAKEIGMNAGQGALNPGNPANVTIGRSHELMIVNLGGAVQGANRFETAGSPFNGGTAFAEDADALPAGWLGFNEESGYNRNQSVVMVQWSLSSFTGGQYAPSSFRGLNSGTGGMARRLGVEGVPGKYNFLEYLVPGLWADQFGPRILIMHPNMAQSLVDYGFQSKTAVMEWLWNASKIPMSEFKKYGWYDFFTRGGTVIEPTSGKPYGELADSYMTPAFGAEPDGRGVIVAIGPGDEICLQLEVGGGLNWGITAYPVDPWK